MGTVFQATGKDRAILHASVTTRQAEYRGK